MIANHRLSSSQSQAPVAAPAVTAESSPSIFLRQKTYSVIFCILIPPFTKTPSYGVPRFFTVRTFKSNNIALHVSLIRSNFLNEGLIVLLLSSTFNLYNMLITRYFFRSFTFLCIYHSHFSQNYFGLNFSQLKLTNSVISLTLRKQIISKTPRSFCS